MKIVTHPDKRLREVCVAVSSDEILDCAMRWDRTPEEEASIHLHFISQQMLKTMVEAGGIGLAGPQVGVMRRIIVGNVSGNVFALANPEIITRHGTQGGKEGCLSYPGRYVYVERAAYVRVHGWDLMGDVPVEIEVNGRGLLATVFQHEIDHLDGVCRVGPPQPKADAHAGPGAMAAG